MPHLLGTQHKWVRAGLVSLVGPIAMSSWHCQAMEADIVLSGDTAL